MLVESACSDTSLDDGDKEISIWKMESASGQPVWNQIFTFDHGLEVNRVFLYLGAKQFVGTTESIRYFRPESSYYPWPLQQLN